MRKKEGEALLESGDRYEIKEVSSMKKIKGEK